VSERAWGTVREDYSRWGDVWNYLPHDHARSVAYRWSEDGIAGLCDNHQRLCFAIALWNGRDPILKERLFGLSGNEGNHGEDVKELYYYLDSTPTHSYMKCLYKYPQAEFPYSRLVEENSRRGRCDMEFELLDTGVFDEDRYFDVFVEYAKADQDDVLIRITAVNRGPEAASLHLLPTVWFRNEWSLGYGTPKPSIKASKDNELELWHQELGTYRLSLDGNPPLLFTENETNTERLHGYSSASRLYKDAFHEHVIGGNSRAVNSRNEGTKAAALYLLNIPPGESRVLRLRLTADSDTTRFVGDLDGIFAARIEEADIFYSFCPRLSEDGKRVQRQAYAGLLWSKQFYHFVIEDWLRGDPGLPPPPVERQYGRNCDWIQLFNADVISMPDKWEYPWYAAWDLAFHMIPLATVDPEFAKTQLALFLREWYMHPNGQLPAYEWNFSDVNPPVHAWSCWRVYQIDGKLTGRKDIAFLESVFHKLLMNFTWWVNRKDSEGNNIFEGGFLGLDNIGLFDRSKGLPGGGTLEQSDGTSWMAMYSLNMLKIASELAMTNRVYEDIASKFFEHFLYIATAMNTIGDGRGLWDEEDGFYYDRLKLPDGSSQAVRVRSMVGLIPLFAVDTLEPAVLDALPGFRKRMQWFMDHRKDLCSNIASMSRAGAGERRLLSLVNRHQLARLLARMLDESEFLSPYGVRSVSKCHEQKPYSIQLDGQHYFVDYEPAESLSGMFGGNSNWRGPVWAPVNYLIIEALQKFDYYFGDSFKVEFPTGSGRMLSLWDTAGEISRRVSRLFLRDADGRRPVNGGTSRLNYDPNFRDYVLFYEYFHGDNGAGLGASHQTGWTGVVAKLLMQSGE
jgi:hypothetical protein